MNTSIRMPAVAGRFYPANAEKLLQELEGFLPPIHLRFMLWGVSLLMLDTFIQEALLARCIRVSRSRAAALCCVPTTPGLVPPSRS